MRDPVVLVFNDYYLPGYKSGGPIRTIANMIEELGDEVRFRVVTRDRDEGDASPYADCRPGCWRPVGKAEVKYLSPKELTMRSLRRILAGTDYDVLYLNSFFSAMFTVTPLLLRRLRLVPEKPVIVAPRGEFSPGALRFKKAKKEAFLALVRPLGLYRDVLWQASTHFEEGHIRRWFRGAARVVVAQDVPAARPAVCGQRAGLAKTAGQAKLVFLSRISRKKNLDGALRMLNGLRGSVQFDIYGPKEDPRYWEQCKALIEQLSENIRVEYHGPVPHENVPSILNQYHLFFFPTHGENFGHVILESLLAGCPVVISDQTPWRNLPRWDAGWDLPLDHPDGFRAIIQEFVDMGDGEFQKRSESARRYGEVSASEPTVVDENRKMFQSAMEDLRRAA